jgi:hypothetical protein
MRNKTHFVKKMPEFLTKKPEAVIGHTLPLYPFHVEILETADLAGGCLLERFTQNLDGAHLRRAVHILVYDVQNH